MVSVCTNDSNCRRYLSAASSRIRHDGWCHGIFRRNAQVSEEFIDGIATVLVLASGLLGSASSKCLLGFVVRSMAMTMMSLSMGMSIGIIITMVMRVIGTSGSGTSLAAIARDLGRRARRLLSVTIPIYSLRLLLPLEALFVVCLGGVVGLLLTSLLMLAGCGLFVVVGCRGAIGLGRESGSCCVLVGRGARGLGCHDHL